MKKQTDGSNADEPEVKDGEEDAEGEIVAVVEPADGLVEPCTVVIVPGHTSSCRW